VDLFEPDDPDAPGVDDGTRRVTRGLLVDRAQRVAALLRDRFEVAEDGHVAMIVGNRTEFIEVQLGALLAGVWVTPVNWHLAPEEAAYVLADSGSSVVFADPEQGERLLEGFDPARVVHLGDPYVRALGEVEPRLVDREARPGGTMFYTSGTTGQPKGVQRARGATLQATLDAMAQSGRALGLDGGGPHLVTGPLYHAAPVGFAVIDLANGAELILMPRFDATATLRLVDERRVRNTHLVPTMFVRMLRLPEQVRAAFSGASLHTVLHGAAPISPAVKRSMIDWWGPVLVEYWGGSEGGVVTLVGSHEWLDHPGTVGRAVAGHQVYAAGDDGAPLPPGEDGLLYTHHPTAAQVFRYHGDTDKTTRAHPGPGTYTLGDIGHVDADGFVYLGDRASHMIISGGVNIYPAEVEAVLAAHAAIADVAVFGVPDEEWGESVKAAVELADGVVWSPELEAEISTYAREHLAGFKVPRTFDVHARLPRADTGKLAVRTLRAPYWDGHDRAI
jgi:long-chain acyl-CoA synthetase